MTDDAFNKNPNECQCNDWTYDHSKDLIWSVIQDYGTGKLQFLGHHPGCPYWIKPPAPALTGLRTFDPEDDTNAIVQLVAAYSELYWSINPPKDPDAES